MKNLVSDARKLIAEARKAAIVAVPALALVVGTDSRVYVKVVAVLVALGVYVVPNKSKV
jgi:hypothetical protein